MTHRVSPQQFTDSDGLADWRVTLPHAIARFRTGSFAVGLALVTAIGELAEAAGHHPDVDLRYPSVTVRLMTHDIGELSDRDVALARQISVAARELGVPADPGHVQAVQLTIDARDIPAVRPFWRAVLGYRERGDADLDDPAAIGPSLWFQQLDRERPQRNRIHVDLVVPPEQVRARIDAAVAAGGRVVDDGYAPRWWTLADSEGNEVDVATWLGRE